MGSLSSRTCTSLAMAGACALLTLTVGFAQSPGDPAPFPQDVQQQNAPLLSPEQLNNLVAPVALYPDPLLSQVLSASTYPLEIIEAQQWLNQNRSLRGTQLTEAARQQNWDPSVQALVVFPNALGLLANDVRWTTDLGNAFLAQQGDVMNAVQTMRARARANGRLNTTPQQVVSNVADEGQNAIEIMPADPQVIYVPVYNPAYVWGQPAWGAYPDLWYPQGFGFGFGFGPAYYMSSFFPGWGGWGGWGWGCRWFGGRSLYLNGGFFNRYGFRGYGGYGGYAGGHGFVGRSAWAHDPGHRLGIPYPNRAVANHFGGRSNFGGGARVGGFAGTARGGVDRSQGSGQWRSFGNGNRSAPGRTDGRSGFNRQSSQSQNWNGGSRNGAAQGYQGAPQGSRSFSRDQSTPRGGRSSGSYSTPSQGFSSAQPNAGPRSSGSRGFSTPRAYSAPNQGSSAPQSYASPRNSGGRAFSAPGGNHAPSQNFNAPRSNSSPRGFNGGGAQAPRAQSAPSHSFSAPRSSPPSGGGSQSHGGGHGNSGASAGRGGDGHRR